ncbi:MAG: alpha/beta fold hydrolase [Candidatus Heimdallarchaeaceae archaeon]
MSSKFEEVATKYMIQVGDGREDKLQCLYYEPKKETNKTLVLIPGFNSLTSAWDVMLSAMMETYRIYVISTREKYNAILSKKADFSPNRFAKDIAEVIDYMMIKDYILVTSSMGGAFTLRALSLGLINPEYTFLVGPVLKIELPSWSWPFTRIFYPSVYRFFLKPLAKLYIKIKYERDQAQKYCGYLDMINASRTRKSLLSLKKFRIKEEELEKISQKCILIGAEKDKLHQAQITHWVHSKIKNSQYFDLRTNIAAHELPLVELIQKIYG